jgi:hypothetical protein
MKGKFWGVVIIASLLVVSAAYAQEAKLESDNCIHLMRVNRKNLDKLQNQQEQRKKAVEAQKCEEEREKQKKAKADKVAGKTGRKATSWQVLNR